MRTMSTVANQRAFTMIELVIAIVVIGISAASLSVVVANSFQAIAVTKEGNARVRSLENCFEVMLAAEERNGWSWSAAGTPFPGCNDTVYNTITDPSAWGSATQQTGALAEFCGDPDTTIVEVSCRTVAIPQQGAPDATGYQFRLTRQATPSLEFIFPE